ncbi:MAG: hypothetical protein ACTSR7_20045 [Promethearchaeota archaeon]
MLNFNLDPADLIKLNLELENIIDESGDLHPLEGKDSYLLSISKQINGYSYYFRHTIPSELRSSLLNLKPEILMNDHNKIRSLLDDFIPCKNAQVFFGCYFKYLPNKEDFSLVEKKFNKYIISVNGVDVSFAWAQEENEKAIEIAVETILEYQKKGYGKQVVSALAYYAIKTGKIAFYSYLQDNESSKALARSLKVSRYAVSTIYS